MSPTHSAPAGAAHSTRLDPHSISTVADTQIVWNIEDGQEGVTNYAKMINDLRTAALNSAGAQRNTVTDSQGRRFAVDSTDPSQSQQFADIVAHVDNGPSVHIRVRLSDFYVVQFYLVEGGGTAGFNLAPNVPPVDTLWDGPNADRTWPEGYDGLARLANMSLTDLALGAGTFNNSVRQFVGYARDGNTTQAQVARAMLTFIVGVAEAARFRHLANTIAGSIWNFAGYQLSDSDVEAMRNWSNTSQIYHNNGGNSISLWGTNIHDAATSDSVLLVALGARAVNSVRHDEL